MELRQLRYALAVADHRHFGRAARELGIAVPPLSRQVAALEAELGARLFERTNHGATPTAAGVTFCTHARAALSGLAAGAHETRRTARGETGTLRIATTDSGAVQSLPALIARFRANSPRVRFECELLPSRRGVAAVLAGEVDACIARVAARLPDQLTSAVVGRDHLVALLHRAHPRADNATVDRAWLRGQVLVTAAAADEPALAEALTFLGEDPAVTAADLRTLVGLVEAGVGVGVLPSSVRPLLRPTTRVVSIHPPAPAPDLLLLARREGQSPALAAFLGSVEGPG